MAPYDGGDRRRGFLAGGDRPMTDRTDWLVMGLLLGVGAAISLGIWVVMAGGVGRRVVLLGGSAVFFIGAVLVLVWYAWWYRREL